MPYDSAGARLSQTRTDQPTDKRVTTSGIDFLRIANGKVVDVRTQWDVYGALRQLGVIPQDLKES